MKSAMAIRNACSLCRPEQGEGPAPRALHDHVRALRSAQGDTKSVTKPTFLTLPIGIVALSEAKGPHLPHFCSPQPSASKAGPTRTPRNRTRASTVPKG